MFSFFRLILYQPLFNLLIALVAIFPDHRVVWAILILTLIIRLILLPVTVHTTRVQARMRLLQPKIDELRKKHKDDKTLQSQALMALYKEEGVSPFSSCLPLIVQLVILIVLYTVFRNGLNTNHFDALYSFTPRPSRINTDFFGIDLAKPDRFILPIIAAITQFWQTKMVTPASSSSDDPMASASKQMIYIAPIMTLVVAGSLPAALPFYWIITNAVTILQQQYVLKRLGLAPAEIKKEAQMVETVVEKSESVKERAEKKKGGVTVTVRSKIKNQK